MLYGLPCGMKAFDLVLKLSSKLTQFGGCNKFFTLMPEFPKIEVTISRTLGQLNLSNPHFNLGTALSECFSEAYGPPILPDFDLNLCKLVSQKIHFQ